MIKDLLVHLDASAHSERRFEIAVALAGDLGARLTALYVVPLLPTSALVACPPGAAVGLAAADLQETLVQPLAEQRDAVRKRITGRAKALDADFQWCDAEGPIIDAIGAWSRCCDLVVVGQEPGEPEEGNPTPTVSPAGVVLEAGRPVLMVPAGEGVSSPGGVPALVAWNHSAESARVLHGALPLLPLAERVDIQTFLEPEPEDDDPGEGFDVAAHCTRRGIDARWRRDRAAPDVAEALLEGASADGCGLRVMGAYGHSRLREYIFGGVTRHVLDHAALPVLVSH